MTDQTDFLADRARAGDHGEFAKLYGRLAPALFAWSEFRLHGRLRKHIDPEDIVQEVWWRALDSFSRFDPAKGKFRAWIFAIATNVYREVVRRRPAKAAGGTTRDARLHTLPPELQAQLTSITKDVALRDNVSTLVSCISELELQREDRLLVVHCGLEGLTAKQAAPLVGLQPEAVKKRWQRLRERLERMPFWKRLADDAT